MSVDTFPLRVYTLDEAATILKVSKRTVIRRIADGTLPCSRDGHIVRITDQHLVEYLHAIEERPGKAADRPTLTMSTAKARLNPELFTGPRRGRSARADP